MKVVVAGASGFIGSALVPFLREGGHTVTPLTRKAGGEGIFWDPERKQIDPTALEGIDAVINLCGETILGRWTQEKMDRIHASRLVPTRFLVETLNQLKNPPPLYIAVSAVGYYGDRGEEMLTETSHSGHGYLAETCREWEEAASAFKGRVIQARLGIVLGKGGGALHKLATPFRLGLGGRLGSGTQYTSWVALDDVVSAFAFFLKEPSLSGPVNVTAPHPVTNNEFTRTIGRVLKRPTPFPVPKWVLTTLFGSGAEIFLGSTQAFPKVLLDADFRFQYTSLESACRKYLK